MNDYVIAIPSYKRHDTLKNKTMKLLERYKVPKKRVYIFVADNSEKNIYEDTAVKQATYNNITDKYELSQYENNITKILSENIAEELLLSIKSLGK